MQIPVAEASSIMGKNFFGSIDMQVFFPQIAKDSSGIPNCVPWSMATLEERKESHLLTYVPQVSVSELARMPELEAFFAELGYNDAKHLAGTEKPAWHLLRKTPTPGSGDKWWLEQIQLLKPLSKPPSVATLVFSILAHFLKTEEQLFEKDYVRTASLGKNLQVISLAGFDEKGVRLDCWAEMNYGHMKIASELLPEI